MSELKWVKTTFGELKAGELYKHLPTADLVYQKRANEHENVVPNHWTVYRLVSPEREALEEIRDEYLNLVRTNYRAEYGDEINDEKAHDMAMGIKMYAIATAALEVKP